MRLPAFSWLFFLLRASAPLHAESALPVSTKQWDHITVAPMATSIYVGSVKLTTGVFQRNGDTFSSTYDAKVVPWFFWGETGQIVITLNDANLAKLAKGETAEFKGEAVNQKNKPRPVTGRVQPANASSGKIKVRVMADGVELIFNGTYRLGAN